MFQLLTVEFQFKTSKVIIKTCFAAFLNNHVSHRK